jgi:uncharacterized protein YndB with AHSA1/START domain
MNETRIELDQRVPLIRITREFNATTAKVFRAHTEADLWIKWNARSDEGLQIDRYDCRTGGAYRYTVTSSGFDATFRGSFHEVRPTSLIVRTFSFEGFSDAVALEQIRFTDLADTRTQLVSTSLVDSFEGRDAMVASGMEAGIRQIYEQLDRVLTEHPPT